MINFRYYKGTGTSYETIELDLHIGGKYITTVSVDVILLTGGIRTFPCGNGDDYRFNDEMYIELLKFLKEERKKITDSYPVKTFEGWHESGLHDYDDYCFPGDKVDNETVEYFINCLPPTTYKSGYVQIGDPYSCEQDENGELRYTYSTFSIINSEKDSEGNPLWLYNGICFENGTVNVINDISRIDSLLEKAIKTA
ncbi:MAG: hypothetical protein LIO87_05670 [Eubacterium sp.]|nr:hypothetical protein [Eubacterium sp.]